MVKKIVKSGPGWRPGRSGVSAVELDSIGRKSPPKPKKTKPKTKGK